MLDTGRRQFITLLGGAAGSWPLVAHAQQRERMRSVGVLMPYAANDPQAQLRNAAFLRGGYTNRNLRSAAICYLYAACYSVRFVERK